MTGTSFSTISPRRPIVLRYAFAALAVYALTLPGALTAHAATKAGVSAAVRGVVERAAKDTAARIRSGQDIFMGDGIRSWLESGMQLMLLDETVFTIGPDSELIVDEFVYDPQTESGHVATTLTKGALRFVTGKVAKGGPDDVTVKMPVGTVGIRGTFGAASWDGSRAMVLLLGPGADNDAFSEEGRLDVTANGQTVELTRPGFGTTIAPGQPPAPAFRFTPELVGAMFGGGPGAPSGDDAGTEDSADTGASTSDSADPSADTDDSGTDTADSSTDTGDAGTDTSDTSTDSGSSGTLDSGTTTDVETSAGGDTSLALEATDTTTTLAASDTSSAELRTQITTQQATADITSTSTSISPVGLTTLQTLAGLTNGSLVFSKTGTPIGFGALGFENGTFDSVLKADLGAQTIGGSTSSIMVTGNPEAGAASTVTYPIPTVSMTSGFRGFAQYDYSLVQSAGTNACFTGCTAALRVRLVDIDAAVSGVADIQFSMRSGSMTELSALRNALADDPEMINDWVSTLLVHSDTPAEQILEKLKGLSDSLTRLGDGHAFVLEAGDAVKTFKKFYVTKLTELTGIAAGVFHYTGTSNFTQTLLGGGSVNFDGTMQASLQIDFGARTFGGGLSGVVVDSTAAGGNINAATGFGTAAFPVAPNNYYPDISGSPMMGIASLPVTNPDFTVVDGSILNEGTAIAARAGLQVDYDLGNGTDFGRGLMLTGVRTAGPAPAP